MESFRHCTEERHYFVPDEVLCSPKQLPPKATHPLCLRKYTESTVRAPIILTKYMYNFKLFSILIKENEVIL